MSALAIVRDPHDAEWYEERRTYIGASDAAIIVGISPWQSEYQLWLEKRGEVTREGTSNAVQSWGHRVEQVAADIYAEVTGRRLRRYGRVQRHREWPFIAANPDRGVIGESRGVQIKSAWKDWTEVPEHYQVQVLWEMGVMGWDAIDVALLTGYGNFAIHTVERDQSMIDHLFAIGRAWWQRHMVEGIEPLRTGRYINALRGEDTMKASETQVELLRALREVTEAKDRLEARERAIKDEVKRSMAGAARLDGKDYGVTATWAKPWSKDVAETDWESVARALRTRWPDDEADALVGLHTGTVTRTGGGGLVVKWKDAPEASQEEAAA